MIQWMLLLFYLLVAFIVNLPFGYWRSQYPKMSWKWLFYIHAPIPGLLLFRSCLGLSFGIVVVLASSLITCILAQRAGGRFRCPVVKE